MKLTGIAMAFVAALLFLVPAAYGVNVVGSSGGHGSSGSLGIGITAADGASVNGVVNGVSLNPTISTSGMISSINENHQVTDSAGNHAEVHATVVNGEDITYWDALSTPDDGSGYVTAAQSLTAGQSDSIKCSQSASDAVGDKASTGIKITSGSLDDYYGFAGAGVNFGIDDNQHAESSHRFDYAEGSTVKTEESASNAMGNAVSSVVVTNGNLVGYGLGDIGGVAEAVQDQGSIAVHMFYGASGTKISLESSASVPDGSKVSATTTIKGTSGQTAVINEYFGISGVNFIVPGPMAFQDYGAMSGDTVNTGLSASNSFGDKASVNTEVKSGTITGAGGSAFDNVAYEIEGYGELIAAQNYEGYDVNSVTGDKLTLTASATTATGLQATKKTVIYNPSDIGYYNVAGVDYTSLPAIPFADQSTYSVAPPV